MSQLPPYRWSLGVLRRLGFTGRTAVIAVPWLWLLLFFLMPFLIVLKISFADTQLGVPPYTPLLEWGEDGYMHFKMNLANFAFILKESLYLERLSQLAESRGGLDDVAACCSATRWRTASRARTRAGGTRCCC